MQIKSLLTFGLIGFAAATPSIERRQAKVVADGLATVKTALTALEKSITAISGTAIEKEIEDFDAKTMAVIDALYNAADASLAAKAWPASDAPIISTPAKDVATITQKNLDALVAKKPMIVKSNALQAVGMALAGHRNASDDFLEAVMALVPTAELKTATNEILAPVHTAFEKAIATFFAAQ